MLLFVCVHHVSRVFSICRVGSTFIQNFQEFHDAISITVCTVGAVIVGNSGGVVHLENKSGMGGFQYLNKHSSLCSYVSTFRYTSFFTAGSALQRGFSYILLSWWASVEGRSKF